MAEPLPSSAQKVQAALDAQGLSIRVVALPASTRTAAEAAQAVGCQVGQIAKSIIFRAESSNRPVLVIASGSNRVNEKRISAALGESLAKADADFVRQRTGFVIGGVPPLGHSEPLETFIDEDLLQYEQVWAAAGTPHAVFRLAPADLVRMAGGRAGYGHYLRTRDHVHQNRAGKQCGGSFAGLGARSPGLLCVRS